MSYIVRLLALPILTLSLIACGSDDTGEVAEIQTELGKSFGGLTATDEDPMFGESETYEGFDEADEDPAETPPADDTEGNAASTEADAAISTAQDENLPEPQRPLVYGILVTWGRQIFDGTAEGPMVWNPTITTDCGVLAVKRRVAMEMGEGVVRPRDSAQSVSFQSATLPSFDGAVVVLVIQQANRDCASTGSLTFESDALDAPLTVPLDDSLADLVLRHPLGDGNNVMAFAHRFEPERNSACVRGHMGGRWVRAIDASTGEPAELGRFYGRVINELGALRGHIRGVWGKAPRGRHVGKHVFYGKYIDQQGNFKGLIAGRYNEGRFGGGWHLRALGGAEHLRGLLGGHYIAGPDDVPEGGLFRGRYASKQCLITIDEQTLEE